MMSVRPRSNLLLCSEKRDGLNLTTNNEKACPQGSCLGVGEGMYEKSRPAQTGPTSPPDDDELPS